MKKTKTLIAGVLAGIAVSAVCLSSAGCGLGANKITPEKLADYADHIGAEQFKDVDDWNDEMIEQVIYTTDYDLLEDGVYLYAEDRDMKDAVIAFNSLFTDPSAPDRYEKSMTKGTFFFQSIFDNGFGSTLAIAYEFDSKEDALEFYEEWDEYFQDQNEDLEDNDFFDADYNSVKEKGIDYSMLDIQSNVYQVDICCLEGKCVLFIQGIGSDEDQLEDQIDDIFESMEVTSPYDLPDSN